MMEQQLASGSLEQALDLFRGEFLQGFYLGEEGQFEEWRRVEESRLHLLVVDGFHKLLDEYTSQGKWEEAIAYNQRLIQIEPLDESARLQDDAGTGVYQPPRGCPGRIRAFPPAVER